MSRLLRIPLLTLSCLVAAAGLVIWDAPRRAAASVEAHRREVEAYLAEPEDHRSARPPLFDPPAPGKARDTYREALRAFESTRLSQPPPDFTLEGALVQLSAYRAQLDRFRDALRQPWVPPLDPYDVGGPYADVADVLLRMAQVLAGSGRDRDAMDLFCLSFGLAQDFIRVGTEDVVEGQLQVLRDGATAALRSLDSHGLTVAELHWVCAALDRLDAQWPSLSDAIERSRVRWTRRVLAREIDQEALSPHYAWTDFSSRTLFDARMLGDIDLHHRAAAERGRRPPWERGRPVRHGDGDHAAIAVIYGSYFCCLPNLYFESEVHALEGRALLRVALALASHTAETGKPPSSLRDLVPRYLNAVPVSPLDGKPFGYAEGGLISRDLKGNTLRWPVRSR